MGKTEVDYLSELIAFRSVSADKEASKACAEFCAGFFEGRGLYTKYLESDGYPNVIATSQRTKKPKILLQAHMDVVPGEEELFTMERKDGKLTGRGTFDMKFACAAYMATLDRLGEHIKDYDFGIMLTFDEEIGGHNGVEALLKKGYGAEVCILPDSGKDWHLETSAHGAWFLKLKKTGKSAHASLPEHGINAAEILTEALAGINKAAGLYKKSELAISLTRINSGKAMNQIPDYAEAVLDIRFRNTSVQEKIRADIDKVCKAYGIKTETIVTAECMKVDVNKQEVIDFVKVAEQVLGRKVPSGHSLGTTDARYFCAYSVPCVVIQPDGGGRHADEEWIDEKGLSDFCEIIHKYILEYAIL
jgi:succinyl-diaminopimelate desuccinylase